MRDNPAETKPTVSAFQRFYSERYMLLVAVAGNLIFYIQAGEIFTSQSAKDVSLWAFVASLWAVTSWFVYGLILRNTIVIVANIVAIIGAILVITGKLMYGL